MWFYCSLTRWCSAWGDVGWLLFAALVVAVVLMLRESRG